MTECTPNEPGTACAIAIICTRCRLCLIHCSCVPPDLRSSDPKKLMAQLLRLFYTRKVGD